MATPEDGRLPAGVRAPAPHLGAETVCVCAGVCVGVRKSRYGAFRDYSGSLVCVESGQRGRPKILHDSPVLLGAFKKKSVQLQKKHVFQSSSIKKYSSINLPGGFPKHNEGGHGRDHPAY